MTEAHTAHSIGASQDGEGATAALGVTEEAGSGRHTDIRCTS
jgi:hypothetical protein